MSLTVALNNAVSGLFANQSAIAATSENIANVNTPDFNRREAHFFTDAIPGQFAGVNVEITRAAVDRFIQSAAYGGASEASRSSVVAEAIARVEASLGSPGDNLSFANELDEAFAAFTLLSADPSSIAARASAVASLDAAFAAFARTQDAIDNETVTADVRIASQVARANTLLAEIFDLNDIVPDSNGAGDEIAARLKELSTLIDINVSFDDDGRVSVLTASGRPLATPGGYSALTFTGGAAASIGLSSVDPASGALTEIAATINPEINGGELGGLLALRNTELPALATIVNNAASAIAADLNAVYAANFETGATTSTATPLIVATGGRFGVNTALLNDPTQLAIARPVGGASGGANDGAGAAAIANIAATGAARDVVSAVTQIGAASRIASDASATAEIFASELSVRAAAEGGVNLDQELSNLILYQRAYNANARIIAAVDEMYQSLLNII